MQDISEVQAAVRLWALVLANYVVLLVILIYSKIRVEWSSFIDLYIGCIILIFIFGMANMRRLKRIKHAAMLQAAGLVVTLPILAASYVSMGIAMPLADAKLAGMDGALGFDAISFIHLIDMHPYFAVLFKYAYLSFAYQILFIPLVLVGLGFEVRGYAMIAAFAILCMLSITISTLYPAVGTYAFYEVDPSSLKNLNSYFGFAFLNEFHAVREQSQFVLNARNASGIITFPSMHAGVAAICAWAMWPSRHFRYIFLALNVAMVVSAVANGGHYLVDIIAGLGISGLVIALVKMAFYHGQSSASESSFINLARSPFASSG